MLCKMFKYSLFICKCSERESHFDCHIDCHFDCNLQLIHKIFIGEDLVVKKKMLPNDPFYKAVLIKESRKKSTVTNVLDDDDYDSD